MMRVRVVYGMGYVFRGAGYCLVLIINGFGLFKMAGFYDELCNMLIRPARQNYSDYDLGTFRTS